MSQKSATSWRRNLPQKEQEEPGWAVEAYQEAWIQTFVQLSNNCSAMNAQESNINNLMGCFDAAKFKRIRLFLA